MKTTHSPPVPETWTVEVDAREHRDLFEREPVFRSGVAVAERWLLAAAVRAWLEDRAPRIGCQWDYGELDGGDPVVFMAFSDEATARDFVKTFGTAQCGTAPWA